MEQKVEQERHEIHYPVIQVGFNDMGIYIHIVRSPHYSEDIMIPEENATPLAQMWLEKQVQRRKDIISTLRKSGKEVQNHV